MAERTKGKLEMEYNNQNHTDTYRVRLVLEKCIHTAIGNWRDTQEIKGRIFFGVTVNQCAAEKDFIQGCNALDSRDALLAACEAWERFINKLPADFRLRVCLWHYFNEAKELNEQAIAKAKE